MDFVIAVIIIVLLAVTLRAGMKRLRGESSSCCGSGTYKARKKRLSVVTDVKSFKVGGMHCQNCVNRVMEAINSMEGLSATVQLKSGRLKVSGEKEIDAKAVMDAVEKAGYTITESK